MAITLTCIEKISVKTTNLKFWTFFHLDRRLSNLNSVLTSQQNHVTKNRNSTFSSLKSNLTKSKEVKCINGTFLSSPIYTKKNPKIQVDS